MCVLTTKSRFDFFSSAYHNVFLGKITQEPDLFDTQRRAVLVYKTVLFSIFFLYKKKKTFNKKKRARTNVYKLMSSIMNSNTIYNIILLRCLRFVIRPLY